MLYRGALADFARGCHKDFSMGATSGEISFFSLETKKTTFSKIFVVHVIENCQILKSRGSWPPSEAHDSQQTSSIRLQQL